MSKQEGSDLFEKRWKDFWHDHKDFDSPWAREILHNLSEFLAFVFNFGALPPGLKQLYVKSGVKFPPNFDWAHEWTDPSYQLPATSLAMLPIFKLALALRAYAYYGLLLNDDDEPIKPAQAYGLEGPVVFVLEFLDMVENGLIPRQWGGDHEMDQTITAAIARQKLDRPEISKALTVDELAALAQISRKTVMNLVTPGKSGVLRKDEDDRITIESAKRWLLSRPDFRASVWQLHDEKSSSAPQPELSFMVEPLFVPVARDGSWFSPADRHQRDNSYYVGNGGDEQKFDNYWAALDFLARAGSPRWRYADTTGRWRVKVSIGWERKSREEVADLLSRDAQMINRKINDMRIA
jgi:hypothetical protein